MEKFKNVCHKIANILEWIIGYSVLICLFVGGLGVIGYIVALCIGGQTAIDICTFMYKQFYVWLIYLSTSTTLLCFLYLYLKGDANWHNPIKYWKNKIQEKKEKRLAKKTNN